MKIRSNCQHTSESRHRNHDALFVNCCLVVGKKSDVSLWKRDADFFFFLTRSGLFDSGLLNKRTLAARYWKKVANL